jgi:hypothetical protein
MKCIKPLKHRPQFEGKHHCKQCQRDHDEKLENLKKEVFCPHCHNFLTTTKDTCPNCYEFLDLEPWEVQ